MRRLFSLFGVAVGLALAASALGAGHVVLVSVDGSRPDFYLGPTVACGAGWDLGTVDGPALRGLFEDVGR